MKKIIRLWTLAALVLGSTATFTANATAALQPMLQSTEKLLTAQSQKFSGLKPSEVEQLRKDFTVNLAMAKNAAKAEFANLSQGKSPEQFDKLMWERTEKAATPAEVVSQIKAMGGPSKAMLQIDRIVDEFSADVLSGKLAQADIPLGHSLLSFLIMAQPAHAGMKSKGCYFMMWAITIGTGHSAAGKLCNGIV